MSIGSQASPKSLKLDSSEVFFLGVGFIAKLSDCGLVYNNRLDCPSICRLTLASALSLRHHQQRRLFRTTVALAA